MSNIAPDKFESIDQKPHLLIVDDDERLRSLLSRFLSESGFLVTMAVDAADAREQIKYIAFDLIIMDVMMPRETGIELTRSLKEKKLATPILLLTALGEVDSRIQGFEAGADDYLSKPFEPRELLLRIHAILRRITAAPVLQDDTVRFGKWTLDLVRGELLNADERQPLTQVEQALLKALTSKRGEVITRDALAKLCDMDAAERTIDVQITRLRKKVEENPKLPKYIQTVRGKGYILWSD